MKVFVYPTHDLLFDWPYFEECTKVQDLFSSELKSCESIDDADLAFFPLQLGSGFAQQKSSHAGLSRFPNLQWEWRTKWSNLIHKTRKPVKHFVVLSYVLFNVNLSFIPADFTILSYETEVTTNILGTLSNFGCYNRMMTIPYFIDTSPFKFDQTLNSIEHDKKIKILFIGSLAHANKYRTPLINLLKPVCLEPCKDMPYLSLYARARLSLCSRGDTPTRACFYQSILVGCRPIIFKHCLIHYRQLYGGILPIESLCLVIPDFDFDFHCTQDLTDSYKKEVLKIVNGYLNDIEQQTRFYEICSHYKSYLDYNHKIENLSAPIYHSLHSMIRLNEHPKQEKKSPKENPMVFIADLDPSFNSKLLPVCISEKDTVVGDKTSQYELEIHWHEVIKNCFMRTSCIEKADFVFIPLYTFLSGWKDSFFRNETITKNVNYLIENIASWKQRLDLPHLIVFSDVLWDTRDSFVNCVDHWPTNTVLISLESLSRNSTLNFNMLTSPYLYFDNNFIIDDQLYNDDKQRKYLLSYIGRKRPPFQSTHQEKPNCKFIFIEMNGWKSSNQASFLKECNHLYLNSKFSLAPPGDRETRRSFFQSVIQGCIPVIFKDNVQGYQQHCLGFAVSDLCIVIPHNVKDCSIPFIVDFISKITPQEIASKRQNIKSNVKNYIFNDFDSTPVFNLIKQVLL